MKTILLIHGPNLNLLGARDPNQYGSLTLADLEKIVSKKAGQLGCVVRSFQSNHEGTLIDWIQKNSSGSYGMIINPGALTHYSYALHDAILDARLPCIEVHISDIHARESWRAISVIAPACIAQISGKKEKGYEEAVELLINSKPGI